MGKSLINGQCSTAMLNYRRVTINMILDYWLILPISISIDADTIISFIYWILIIVLSYYHTIISIILSYLSYYHIYINGTIISIIEPHYNHSPFHFALDGRVEPKRPRRPRWSSPWTASSRRMTTSSRPRTTWETDVTAGGEWQWMAGFIGFKML